MGYVRLKTSVRLPAEADAIRLADIADLEGPAAAALAGTTIKPLSGNGAAVELSLSQIRAALDEAGIHWGRVNLSGRGVIVRPRQSAALPPRAMSAAAIDGADARRRQPPEPQEEEPAVHTAADLVENATLRGALVRAIVRGLEVDPADVRLTFDARDAEALDASLDEQRFEIEPVSGLHGSRINIAVRTWRGNRVEQRRTFSVTSSVRRPALRMVRDVSRGQQVTSEDIEVIAHWAAPNQPGLAAETEAVVGREAAVRLRAGDLLRDQHLRREMLIRRGQHVTVRCIVGTAVISLHAESRADGGEGDLIEFRKIGERETFLATVSGRGEAIVDLSR